MMNEYYLDEIYVKHEISPQPNAKDFTMHIHEHCEIYLFIQGKIEYLVEGSRYPLPGCSLMIMRPAEAHTPKIIGDACYERYAVNFPLSLVHQIDPDGTLLKPFFERPLGKNNFYSAEEINVDMLKKLFDEMCNPSENRYEKKLTATTHIYMLLDMINRAFSQKKTDAFLPKSLSEKIIVYIEKHITEELSVPKLAEQFHLSCSQFTRVFKQATGAAPWDYITKKRLTAAKEKIRNGYSAKNACEACGFNDYSAFYRAYTKHFGNSPKETPD